MLKLLEEINFHSEFLKNSTSSNKFKIKPNKRNKNSV